MSFHRLALVQGSEEWKAARFDHVTASNVPAVLGLSPYKTALQYAEELLAREEAPASAGKQTLYDIGHKAEIAARDWIRANFGHDLAPAVVVGDAMPCLLASLDGIDETKGLIFESKYVGSEALADVRAGKLKPHHEVQVQAQLLASGMEKCIYFALDRHGEAAIAEILPDRDWLKEIVETVPLFWENLGSGILPEPTDLDVVKVDDADLVELARLEIELAGVEAKHGALKKRVLAKYEKYGRVQGNGVSISRYWAKGNVDWSKIPALRGVDQERFRKAGSFRTRITIDKGKK